MMGTADDNEMTFWDHLDELRKIIFRILIFVGAATGVIFTCMKEIFDKFILAPTRDNFFLYEWFNQLGSKFPVLPDFTTGRLNIKIININLASQFLTHMSASLWLGVLASFPFVIYQLFIFVKPALHLHEKRNVGWAFLFGNMLFYSGILVGYSLVFPLTLRFLAGYELSPHIENSISLDSYMNNFIMLCFILGLVFELPLLSWLLSKLGVLHKSFFSKFRKHAIVVLLIVAALITPSGDPFTLIVVFSPLYILWEISALAVVK
ncbi:MAG TPA: twin-arginine translocase subunit TatC [Paludibacter sp.]|nr:twin-arginine translocase subunit TatC [Paludibacter sp.]